MKLTSQLEKTFGTLSKTLLFEYQTIAELARYFSKVHPGVLRKEIGLLHEESKPEHAEQNTPEKPRRVSPTRRKQRFPGNKSNYKKEIAIIGLSGRYPRADNLKEFWKNLQDGRDCISEIPAERWDYKLYYDPNYKLGKTYSKWGGFISDVDKFDPLFFNMSPKEAGLIDPQERLFLETAWETIEDAGYTKENIAGSKVGVFVGVMWGHYELFGAQSTLSHDNGIPSSSHASIANRVSYFFNFHGPSIALDTMCSSSLTAIHLACEELRKGDIDAAIAGGVNVTIHPNKYLSLSQGKFVASDGRCRSFGEGGDGYVPGEGVGAVLLKPLEDALRDGDQIYAVIKSSTVNHGGKTNGYTVPNPNAQGDLILDALRKANIDPRTLNYVEAHGTGTSLGDPIEIAGLSKAFEGFTEEKQFCAIGSVKSNIGHLEAAAGIAAVTKALLQIRYQQLVPSLHAHPFNPNIDFGNSPFYVQTELAEWKRPVEHSRRVAVSSFGAGGSNAHIILEEYPDTRDSAESSLVPSQEMFVLSAKNQEALYRYAERMVNFLENTSGVSLANIAYTSQLGRTPMDVRLVVLTSSKEDLRGKLNQWIALRKNKETGSGIDNAELSVFCGNVKESQYNAGNLIDGRAGKVFLEHLLTNHDLEKIARLWILGAEINWSLLYQDASRRRVTLPTYPFAKERCWLDQHRSDTGFIQNTLATEKVPAQRRAEEIQRASNEVPSKKGISISRKSANTPRDGLEGVHTATLVTSTEEYLKGLIGEELKLASDRINSSDRLESFGIDSVMISRINAQLEKDLGALPKTLLYEHETVGEIANFLVQEMREALIALFGYSGFASDSAVSATDVKEIVEETTQLEIETRDDDLEAIAIIGVHGYYPRSATLDEYWENLKEGRDLIDSVPSNRWNCEEMYDPDPAAALDGKIYCKWGGFLDDVDKFDARFFNIPAEEAKIIDPQERLFLESVWAAIEDAGYTRDGLKKRFPKAKSADVGVFVGVTTSSYQLWALEEQNQGKSVFPSAMPWSIANRVSYFFDFNGPSMPIDTACSSSLVAVHLACESLRKRECQVAIAGGVNLYLHPSKYRSLCQRRMLSLGGKCHSYGSGDDGFVPGEGVGSVVLKPLSKAIHDQDRIHAVIRASAFNHSGRSNGYSAPNPNSQAHLISSALSKAGIDPESISYVEGHGTGTQLGDSIEIAALTQAFQTQTTKKQFCAIGSVKANIGHSESAAGIAGLAKVILQIKHGQLAPSIHSNEVNPDIEFKESPFCLQHELSEWKASPLYPRRALINSFGAGGVNACIVLEQYEDPGFSDDQPETGPYLFVLSAKNERQLREYVDRVLIHLRSEPAINLTNLCYTLQAGREALEERLAIVVTDASQLLDFLTHWLKHGSSPNVHRGTLGTPRGSRQSSTLAGVIED
jgi:acyl transferase domain-containing protein